MTSSCLRTHRCPISVLALLLTIILTTCADDMIPYFTVEPSSTVVSQDAPVNLSCHAHPPSMVVRWKLNNQVIASDNSDGIKLLGNTLFMPHFPSNAGDAIVIQCVATSPLGSIVSQQARISKAVLRRFEDQPDRHLNVTEGLNFMIPCDPPYSRPKANIMYKVNDSLIIEKDTDHYKMLPSGNLLIIKVTPRDSGQYRCMAQNSLRNRTQMARHVVHLHVLTDQVPNREPAVIMPSGKVQAVVGDNVVLEGSAIGNPIPIITWEKYGGKLPPGRFTQKYGNLYLENVTREDEGTYLCKAHNGLNFLMPDGVMAKILEISEPPSIQRMTPAVNVSLGGHIELECKTTGKPKPHLIWLHNGNVLKSFNGDQKLIIRHAVGQNQGFYQCFTENEVGFSYATMLVTVDITKQDSGSLTLSDQNVLNPDDVNVDTADGINTTLGGNNKRQRHKTNKQRKQKRRRKNGRREGKNKSSKKNLKNKLVPPNKPEVKQLSDTSVMLNWTVPENEGLKITLFRVQYKKIAPKKGNWKTEDVDIDSNIRMYEVKNLKPRATYKFRIAAVYSNDDNAHGPNSDKFEMMAEQEPASSPPEIKPTIVEVTPIVYESMNALNIKWQLSVMSSTPIEGFFIYYKPYHASDDFQNVTLLQASVRVHLLTNLLGGTEYLIKMQSFNDAGRSPFSNEVVKKTIGPDGPYQPPPVIDPDKELSTIKTKTTFPEDDTNRPLKAEKPSNSETLYMVLGIVLGVMMLVLVIFMFMCWWKQRQQRRLMEQMNDAVRHKFQDPNQRAYTDSLRKKMINGGVPAINGINGTIANGHIPRNFHKMNINVNPLSELDALNSTDGSNHFTPSTFHPNGTLPGQQHRASDNNCNNINQSKGLENNLQHLGNHSNPDSGDAETMGGGEALAPPPSPGCSVVPIGHNSVDALERRSISNRSCDRMSSCDPCDSSLSYDDTGGVNISGRHRKHRRRTHDKEQTTKDQATNTDLSSNDGTMDLGISSSLESGQMGDNSRTDNVKCESPVFVPRANAV